MNQLSYFKSGLINGIPVGLGYFAVSFTLGIAAQNAGLNPSQGLLSALLLNASAGQYAVYNLIESNATLIELIMVNLIVNARYILMSLALSQRLNPESPMIHRFLMSLGITDELFSLAIAQDKYINPYYYYGTMTSLILWALGTFMGVIAGNLLPIRLVSAFSVALFVMFIAAVIPATKINRIIAIFVGISYLASFLTDWLGLVDSWGSGLVYIVLTVIISSLAALLFPISEREVSDE